MTAIRLGRERLTAVANGFTDLISDTCASESAIPNGFLNGSVFGNDIGSLSAHCDGILAGNRGAAQFGPAKNAKPDNGPREGSLRSSSIVTETLGETLRLINFSFRSGLSLSNSEHLRAACFCNCCFGAGIH